MDEEERRLREEIEQYLRECDEVDRQEDELYGDARGDELPGHLRTAAQRREAIRKAKAELEAEAQERARQEQEARRVEPEKQGRDVQAAQRSQRRETKSECAAQFHRP